MVPRWSVRVTAPAAGVATRAVSPARFRPPSTVLERARLVSKRPHGRERLVRVRLDTLRDAQRLLDRYERIWRDRLDRFDDVLADTLEGDRT